MSNGWALLKIEDLENDPTLVKVYFAENSDWHFTMPADSKRIVYSPQECYGLMELDEMGIAPTEPYQP